MKHYLVVVLLLAFASYSLGQTPSAPPTKSASQEKPKLKDFGASLRKFGKKEKDTSKAENGQSEINDEDIIRIKTDLVISDVLVVNQKGNVVLGLEQDDFVVTENGVLQKISMFSFGENATIPRSIVLIIDYSGSQMPFIRTSIEAAKVLVDKLAPQDSMAIVTDDVKLLVAFTKDKALLKKELDNLGKKPYKDWKFGRSEQYTALVATLNEMFDEEDIRPIVIFQTDGDELLFLKGAAKMPPSYYHPSIGNAPRKKDFSFEDVCTLVSKSRATIYSIIPDHLLIGLSQEEQLEKMESWNNQGIKVSNEIWGTRGKQEKFPKDMLIRQSSWHLQWQLALTEIAKLSGGYTDFIERPEDAENVYSDIFTIINNRYVIGYYPTNKERDEKRRNVKIEVRNHPEYSIIGRKAFFLQ
jgi:VWFA-related protein